MWSKLSAEEIAGQVESYRAQHGSAKNVLPHASILHALIQTVGQSRIKAIVDRHNEPSRAERFGTPDLFLFAWLNATGLPTMARFVEVKKPRERISPDQSEEIKFLKSIGLKARVLRLIEVQDAPSEEE